MYAALKLDSDIDCEADIPKAVFSYWPLFAQADFTGRTLANVCFVIRNLGLRPLHGVEAYFRRDSIDPGSVRSIATTLLDPRNPLSTSFSGQYKISDRTPDTLAYYDGIPEVYIDHGATYAHYIADHDVIRIRFSKSPDIGESLAVRFTYTSRSIFIPDQYGILHFQLDFFDVVHVAAKLGPDIYVGRALNLWMLCDQWENGGIDIFCYLPLEYSLQEAFVAPMGHFILRYDHHGHTQEQCSKKYSWPPYHIFGSRSLGATPITRQNHLSLSGVFVPRVERERVIMVENKGIVQTGPNAQVSGNIQTGDRSTISNSPATTQNVVADQIDQLLDSLQNELDHRPIPGEERESLNDLIRMMKENKTSNEPGRFARILRSLERAATSAGVMVPNVVEVIDKIKNLFQNGIDT